MLSILYKYNMVFEGTQRLSGIVMRGLNSYADSTNLNIDSYSEMLNEL